MLHSSSRRRSKRLKRKYAQRSSENLVEDMSHQINEGQDINTEISEEERKTVSADLTCALCLDIFKNPVTIQCGHSFCRICLCRAAIQLCDRFYHLSCPCCRSVLKLKDFRDFNVNKSLSNIIEHLYPHKKPDNEEKDTFAQLILDLKRQKPELLGTNEILSPAFNLAFFEIFFEEILPR